MSPSSRSATGRAAVQAAGEKLAEAQQTLAGALEGSGHETVEAAQASLTQAEPGAGGVSRRDTGRGGAGPALRRDAVDRRVHRARTSAPRSAPPPTSCPLGLLALALEKFGLATERLRWVRQESANPMGVPELVRATEHAETAGHALRVAQEQLRRTWPRSGWPPTARRAPGPQDRRAGRHDAPRDGRAGRRRRPSRPPERLRRWWAVRVAELTGGRDGRAGRARRAGRPTPRELLRRVVGGVRAGDRDRLRADLRRAHADVGAGPGGGGPAAAARAGRRAARARAPRRGPARLRGELDGRVRDLLPGLPPAGAGDPADPGLPDAAAARRRGSSRTPADSGGHRRAC